MTICDTMHIWHLLYLSDFLCIFMLQKCIQIQSVILCSKNSGIDCGFEQSYTSEKLTHYSFGIYVHIVLSSVILYGKQNADILYI